MRARGLPPRLKPLGVNGSGWSLYRPQYFPLTVCRWKNGFNGFVGFPVSLWQFCRSLIVSERGDNALFTYIPKF